MFKITDLASDDVEAGASEADALDVDAEAFGKGVGIGEAETEQEAEGVGIVVEGGAIEMAFDSLRAFRGGRSYRHMPRYASRAARKTSAGTVLLTACQSTKARST